MDSLVGQAAKDDEEFWNHSTWAEEKDDLSDDGSFHESDEESDAKVDTFDSDFNDSEGEDDEDGEGGEEELLKEERQAKRAAGKKRMMDAVNAGRELMQKRKSAAKRKKAMRGSDANAGLVLNFPGAVPNANRRAVTAVKSFAASASGSGAVGTPLAVAVKPQPLPKVKVENAQPSRRSARSKATKFSISDVVGKRSFRTSTINNSIEQASSAMSLSTRRQAASIQQQRQDQQEQQDQQAQKKNKHKRKFTQEELLLEALSKTEGENQRWLLNRKRLQVEENTKVELKKKLSQQSADKKVVSKFNSRRGCLNTFTFPEMDHVPEIFMQLKVSSVEQRRRQMIDKLKKESVCVITGKEARYRDPKSRLGYHDLAAFKELRRRLDAGISVGQVSGPLTSTSTSSTCIDAKEVSSQSVPPIVKKIINVVDATKNVTNPHPIKAESSSNKIEGDKSNPSLAPKKNSKSADEKVSKLVTNDVDKKNKPTKAKASKEIKKTATTGSRKREASSKAAVPVAKKAKKPKSESAATKEVKPAATKVETLGKSCQSGEGAKAVLEKDKSVNSLTVKREPIAKNDKKSTGESSNSNEAREINSVDKKSTGERSTSKEAKESTPADETAKKTPKEISNSNTHCSKKTKAAAPTVAPKDGSLKETKAAAPTAAPKDGNGSKRKRSNSNSSRGVIQTKSVLPNEEKKTKDATSRSPKKAKSENNGISTASYALAPAPSNTNTNPADYTEEVRLPPPTTTPMTAISIEHASALAESLQHADRVNYNQQVNNQIMQQPQYPGQSMSNIPINPISSSYHPYDMNNINTGMLNDHNSTGNNSAIYNYSQAAQHQLQQQYQPMLAPPAMDVASMLAMSLNSHAPGMPMQAMPHYSHQHHQDQQQQLQHQTQQLQMMLARHNQASQRNGSARNFDDGRQHERK